MKRGKWLLAFGLAAAVGLGASNLRAASIIDEWASVKAPPPPELKAVTVDPKTTALLMLDFVKPSCNPERGRRCIETLPAVKKLLGEAHGKGMLVIYTAYGKLTENDIVPEVAPNANEPFVVSFLNKYIGTELEKILKDKGIQTVITVGTFAHGSVLTTASDSALRGFKVIVPVDGMSFEQPLRRTIHRLASRQCAGHRRQDHSHHDRHDEILSALGISAREEVMRSKPISLQHHRAGRDAVGRRDPPVPRAGSRHHRRMGEREGAAGARAQAGDRRCENDGALDARFPAGELRPPAKLPGRNAGDEEASGRGTGGRRDRDLQRLRQCPAVRHHQRCRPHCK